MNLFSKIFIFLGGLLFSLCIYAQEGGPPMLTDDARVADFHEWELNTSINTSFTDHLKLSVPHIDLNYGIAPNLQLKAEAPIILTFDEDNHTTASIGEIIVGIKYRFLDEEKYFISAATFPQYVVRGRKGLLVPVFLEKTIGQFLIGTGVGYFFGEHRQNQLDLGTIVGFKPTEDFDLMLEYMINRNFYTNPGTKGYLNIGFRQSISKHFSIMGSFGTQVVTPKGQQREVFISWLGLQSLF